MTISLKHATAVVVADDGTSPVGSDEWNAEHTFTVAANKVLGGVSAGAVVEIDCTAAGRALLDDANAAAQLTTLGAAPTASPALTGTPTAPTASAATNTTQLATTAFTQQELTAQAVKYSASQTLTAAQQAVARTNVSAALKGQIFGLTLSNNASDATNDIDIAVGEAASSETSPVLMVLASAITKRLDASWAVGTNQGGRDTGSIANGTWHVWLIQRSDTGVVDVLFSLSATAPSMPTNYDRKRRIGAILRVSAAIVAFIQVGDRFTLRDPGLDLAGAGSLGTSAVLRALTVPSGIKVTARLNIGVYSSDAGTSYDTRGFLSSPDEDDNAFAGAYFNYGTLLANGYQFWSQIECETDISSQIRTRNQASSANTLLWIATRGWVDRRNQDA